MPTYRLEKHEVRDVSYEYTIPHKNMRLTRFAHHNTMALQRMSQPALGPGGQFVVKPVSTQQNHICGFVAVETGLVWLAVTSHYSAIIVAHITFLWGIVYS